MVRQRMMRRALAVCSALAACYRAEQTEPEWETEWTSQETGPERDTEIPDLAVDPSCGLDCGYGHDTEDEDPECDVWAQDCPFERKCVLRPPRGEVDPFDAHCVDVVPDPDPLGEPCMFTVDGLAHGDTCPRDSLCTALAPDDVAVCLPLCAGTIDAPVCPDPKARCVIDPVGSVCVPGCDPAAPTCPASMGCYPDPSAQVAFACSADTSGWLGALGVPCSDDRSCDPGNFCAPAGALPDCPQGRCCTAFCQLGSTTCESQDPRLHCAAWFDPGHAPPGLALVGGCIAR